MRRPDALLNLKCFGVKCRFGFLITVHAGCNGGQMKRRDQFFFGTVNSAATCNGLLGFQSCVSEV